MTTNDKTHDPGQFEPGEFVQVTSAHGNNGLAVILGAIPGEGQQPTLYRLGRIRPRRDQRTGGALVTRDGRIVAEWHQRRATTTDPGGAWVASEDMQRIVGGTSWVNALGMAQAQIGRALREPVVALKASELTMGAAPRYGGGA